MPAFEHVEQQMAADHNLKLSRTWESGRIWFRLALSSINGATPLITDHIVPKFTEERRKSTRVMHEFWHENTVYFIKAKLDDFKTYDAKLRELCNV